ncbi:hemerythrin domain-containing protein [Streptomyces sp. ICBB 8177]|uniref:hemerythrin domain-containing protein n=1 Tax=Streptomyces sp. ICBB 8177 TaxID=563922 RepID=UPI00130513DE|nr:hemerythrin domain-containing protein [Streptomyces sp. ICBB 8177]
MTAPTLPGTPPASTTPAANNLTGFTITHDLIRRVIPELGRRLAAGAATGTLDDAAVARLTRWWEMFTAILGGHHTSEDSHVWPVVLATEPTLGEVSDALEAQHATLDERLAEIERGLRGLPATGLGDASDPSGLLARIAAFSRMMDDHLRLEEETMVPVLRDRVPPQEYAGMLRALAEGHDPADFVPTMPLLLERASASAREFMLGGMPAPLRERYEREWEPAYRELAASLPPDGSPAAA